MTLIISYVYGIYVKLSTFLFKLLQPILILSYIFNLLKAEFKHWRCNVVIFNEKQT